MLTESIPDFFKGTEPSKPRLLIDLSSNDNLERFFQENGHTSDEKEVLYGRTESQPSEDPSQIKFVSPRFEVITSDFKLLQLWHGRIDKVFKEEFVATIFDKMDPTSSPEQVTISNEEIDLLDSDLLKPGAVFYWSIGYANYTKGPRQRTSRIRLRRLVLPKGKIELQQREAKHLASIFAGNSA